MREPDWITLEEHADPRCDEIVPHTITGFPDAQCVKTKGHPDECLFNVPRIRSISTTSDDQGNITT
jgi:hypothetical protein